MPLTIPPNNNIPQLIAGRYFSTFGNRPIASAAIAAVDTIYLYPYYVSKPITVVSGVIRVVTGGAGSSIKSAIWANDAATNKPIGAPLLADNTGVDTSGSGVTVTPALAGKLGSGWIWIGSKATGTLPACVSIEGTHLFSSFAMGTLTSAFYSSVINIAQSYASAMPTFTGASSFNDVNVSGTPIIGFRL